MKEEVLCTELSQLTDSDEFQEFKIRNNKARIFANNFNNFGTAADRLCHSLSPSLRVTAVVNYDY